MNQQRRSLLKYSAVFGLMASAGLISVAQAQEWNKAAFEGKGLDDVFKILGAGSPDKSGAVTLNVGLLRQLRAQRGHLRLERGCPSRRGWAAPG